MLPPPPPNFTLFQLDFDVKFPLLRLLLFLIDLKSTIFCLINSRKRDGKNGKVMYKSSLLNRFPSYILG